MDNYDYLNQIAQDNRPVKAPILASGNMFVKIGLIAGIGVLVFLFLLLLGNLLRGKSVDSTELIRQLHTRTTNVNTVNQEYVRSLKSSRLRSIGASINGACLDAQVRLSDYLTTINTEKKNTDLLSLTDETAIAEEAQNLTELEQKLQNAKLNGILDRSYANFMGLQMALLMSQISNLQERTTDEALLNILSTYYSSISVIYQSFEEYFNPAD